MGFYPDVLTAPNLFSAFRLPFFTIHYSLIANHSLSDLPWHALPTAATDGGRSAEGRIDSIASRSLTLAPRVV